MSVEDEIDRLDERVTRLENSIDSRLRTMDDRMERMEDRMGRIEQSIASLSVQIASRRECPEPGACVYLRHEINGVAARVNEHGLNIRKLEINQAWIFGGLALLGTILTLFGPSIRAIFKLP